MSDFKYPFEGFKSSAERIVGEREERLEIVKNRLSFGVQYLDECLGGIFRNDLVLLGAKSGLGKTQLAMSIAVANATAGKRVHYFALEAEPGEIERRAKYRRAVTLAYKSDTPPSQASYTDWYTDASYALARQDGPAEKHVQDSLKTLFTLYKGEDFTGDMLSQSILGIHQETDLIIVDHLHYVDIADTNENRGLKDVVKTVRDVSISVGKPVILVAHVRKWDARSKQLLPDLEDFHGTSDTPKIATKAIMIGPARDVPQEASYLWPTYMAVLKCRLDGARARYAALVNYDSQVNAYEKPYHLGRLTSDSFTVLPEAERPHWAKSAKRIYE